MGALRWSLILGIWVAVALTGVGVWYGYDLPTVIRLEPPTRRASISVVAADGAVLATYGDLYGGPVRVADVSPRLVQAIVATEDRRFYDHAGFDPIGILRAAWVNWRAGSVRQGASTITQQVAKNVFLTPERTFRRKLQEVMIAVWLEARFSKEQILTLYLNRVYMGAGTYGVAAASQRYFGKPAKTLDLAEAAVIAGLPKAPSRLSPLSNPDGAWERAKVVLVAMAETGFVSEAAAANALRPSFVAPAGGATVRYFTDWVVERAADYVGAGNRDLVVVTTIDAKLQRVAEEALTTRLDQEGGKVNAGQGAVVALSPDGAVRAMVGGRDYQESQFNRAAQGNRQPGSAFKLFVFLAGLEAGIAPSDVFDDAPVSVGRWQPGNFDGRYRGAITLREAAVQSINTVAVRVSERVGRERVIAAARRLGISTKIPPYPSLALGTAEVSLVELTAAYGALPAGGRSLMPHGIVEIRDTQGRVLYRRQGSGGGQAIAPGVVAALNDMLGGVIAAGTGRAAAIGRPAAGKTGTTQDYRDAWFVGYTADLVAGVWVGNDDNAPMKGVTGGQLPARIWRDFMAVALAGTPPKALPLPARDGPAIAAAPTRSPYDTLPERVRRALRASGPTAPHTTGWVHDDPGLRE